MSGQALLAGVQRCYAKRSVTANFKQTYTDAVLGPRPSESGTLAIDAAGRMRFAYEQPEAKTFVFDGQQAAMVEPTAKQVTVLEHFAGSQAGHALSLLTGAAGAGGLLRLLPASPSGPARPAADAAALPDPLAGPAQPAAGQAPSPNTSSGSPAGRTTLDEPGRLNFAPSTEGAAWRDGDLQISLPSCQIVALRYADLAGNTTSYELTERRLGAALNENLFLRQWPADYSVLHADGLQ